MGERWCYAISLSNRCFTLIDSGDKRCKVAQAVFVLQTCGTENAPCTHITISTTLGVRESNHRKTD